MVKYLVLFILLFPLVVHGGEKEDAHALMSDMAVANYTGMCRGYAQMVRFQETAKMVGGTAFTLQFMHAEATRLGYPTPKDFYKTCLIIADEYDLIMKGLRGIAKLDKGE